MSMSHRGSRGYRGRGRFQPRQTAEPSAKLQEGLSDNELGSISLPETRLNPSGKIEATNVVALGSYNWVDHSTPTIVIPGNPPTWKEPEFPMQLEPDSGISFIDQNTARVPLNPLEPMLRAITLTQKQLGKDFNLADERIDIVTDRNNLRKLMRFVTSKGPNRDHRPGSNRDFRIDVQLAPNGRTLVFTRQEEKHIDNSTGFKGYGHNFERATTEEFAPLLATNQTRTHISRLKSTGHHRITRYDFLGLRFLVRYEVDAMIAMPQVQGSRTTVGQRDELDDLANIFARTSLLESKSIASPKLNTVPQKPNSIIEIPDSELRYVLHGELVPQAHILELRTIKSKYNVPWSDVYPQLFLSQTPTIHVAKQLDGYIDSIRTHTRESSEMQKAHINLGPDFVALVNVLTRVRNTAKDDMAGRPFAIYWSGTGDLKIRALRHTGHLLSEKELAVF